MKLSLRLFSDVTYYFCLSCYIAVFCFSNSSFTEVFNFNPKFFSYIYWIICILLSALFSLSYILYKFKEKVFFFSVIYLFSAAIASLMVGNDLSILIGTLLILDMKGRKARTSIFCVFLTYATCAIAIVTSALCGFIPNKEVFGVDPFKVNGVLKRHTYGFMQVNVLGVVLLVLFLCFFVLFVKKLSSLFFLFSLCLCLILYFIINSKTAAFIIPVTIIIYISLLNIKKCLKVFASSLLVVPYIFSMILVFNYSTHNSFLVRINNMLSNRISLAKEIYSSYGFSLLGRNIHLISTVQAKKMNLNALVLDNAYFHLMIRYGLLMTICFIILYFAQISLFSERKFLKILTVCIVFFLCGISETWMLRTEINFTLLCILPCLNEAKKQEYSFEEK